MSNHTPGPWLVKRRFDVYQDTQKPGVGGTFIASTKGNSPLPEHINQVCEADARLIAAAPDLLMALDQLVFACELPGDHCEVEQALPAAIAAIAKATGGTQ